MEQAAGLKIVRRKYLVDEVIRQLQEQISAGTYKIGTRIPTEPELMEQLAVSRTTVRGAVRVLANAGLLEVRPGLGTFVRAGSTEVEPFERRLRRASVAEIIEVHRLLAIEIAKLAARRRTQEDLMTMHAGLEKKKAARKLGNLAAYLEKDAVFYNAIAIASKNLVLRDVYAAFAKTLYGGITNLHTVGFPEDEHTLDNQWQLLQAIAEQNPENATKWIMKSLNEGILHNSI